MENIKNLIHNIRDMQVILDSDVAMLYGYETRTINQTVRRNSERFPKEFCFQLTIEEYDFLISQFVISKPTTKLLNTSNTENRGGRRKLPYVFTEQGIAMLSGLLKNQTAIKVSINIMNAFVEMRKFISNNGQIFERLTNVEYKLLEHDKRFDELFDSLQGEKEFKQNKKLVPLIHKI